jgi:hypothetical protein
MSYEMSLPVASLTILHRSLPQALMHLQDASPLVRVVGDGALGFGSLSHEKNQPCLRPSWKAV